MRKQALDYYIHGGEKALRFELSGVVNEEAARQLDESWRTASPVIGDRRLIIDISFVTAVDEPGRVLLVRWHRQGAQFVADSPASRVLAESITGAPLADLSSNTHTWLPFRGSFIAHTLSQ